MVACLYIPEFPAWAVEQATPSYSANGRPVTSPLVVVAAGHVLSVNRAAKRAGIVPGITTARAQSLFPELRIHLRDGELEEAAWEDALLQLNQITPFLEHTRAPFAYFNPGEPDEARALIKSLQAKAGIATHRSFAKLAALRAANGNLLVLPERSIKPFLQRFPVGLLTELSFDDETIERLELFGYANLEAVRELSHHHIEAQFGQEGDRLFSMLHPDTEPSIKLFDPPPMVGCVFDLDNPQSEPGELRSILDHLIKLVIEKLHGLVSQRVIVSVKYHGSLSSVSTTRILGTATDKPASLFRAGTMLLDRLLGPDKNVETIQFQLGALRYAQATQTTLFRERPSPYSAVKAVHRRHPGLIKKAVIQPGALFTDEAIRLEPFEKPPAARPRTRKRKIN